MSMLAVLTLPWSNVWRTVIRVMWRSAPPCLPYPPGGCAAARRDLPCRFWKRITRGRCCTHLGIDRFKEEIFLGFEVVIDQAEATRPVRRSTGR